MTATASQPQAAGARGGWPASLFGRLMLILFAGIAAAHVLSFWLVFEERGQATRRMMVGYLAKDVATAVAVLERVDVRERSAWLARLDRSNYRFILGEEGASAAPAGAVAPAPSALARQAMAALMGALGPAYAVTSTEPPEQNGPLALHLHLRLADGTPLTVAATEPRIALSGWALLVLSAQLLLLAGLTAFAVRLATRPLAQLAQAADALGPDFKRQPLAESGPREVATAAAAFNAMQRRIAEHVAERIQILAAITHDLQTPITRMRLRAELLDDTLLRDKLHSDLGGMQRLVEDGLAYARSAHGATEMPCRTDLRALLESLVFDFADAGQAVQLLLEGHTWPAPLMTRPQALRRILTNLLDNALKFGREVELAVASSPGGITLTVRDRGPGIPEAEIARVLLPFYRVEASRSRDSGGTGLGLATAQQLALACGGTLTLANRDGGGLQVQLCLPLSPHAPPLRGSLDVAGPEAQPLRPVQACAGRLGAAGLSPSEAQPCLGRPGAAAD